ncbi:hypothetical protein ACSQ67_010922 [Phaseolus vulgaris]
MGRPNRIFRASGFWFGLHLNFRYDSLPENSHGEWLGIVNASSNGTSQAGILAVEFDTRHSFTEDGPDKWNF